MAMIFHVGKWGSWIQSPVTFALAVSAFYVLLKPSSILRFLIMIALQLWLSLDQLPWGATHWLFVTFANLTIVLAVLLSIISTKKIRIDRDEFLSSFAPALRLELIILYFFAVFHKLNADWFNPLVSCATHLFNLSFSFIPDSSVIDYTTIYGVLLIEAFIPICLIIPRTRYIGIFIALVFHFVLGISGYFNFSSMMYAVLFLFTPINFVETFERRFLNTGLISHIHKSFIKPLSRSLEILLAILTTAVLIYSPWVTQIRYPSLIIRDGLSAQRPFLSYGVEPLWWVYGLAIIAIFILSIHKSRELWPGYARFFLPPHKLVLLVPILVFINGLSPYLGMKTENTWSMFSNLKTEQGTTNHLLVSDKLSLSNHQDDLVQIRSSSDSQLQKIADTGFLIPYFELRSYMHHKYTKNGSVIPALTYTRGGDELVVNDITQAPDLFSPYPVLVRKALRYKLVWPGNPNICIH